MAVLPGIGRSIRIFNPKKVAAAGFVADLTKRAQGYKRSIRRNGGYWRGQLSITGEAQELANYFNEWLGCHFEERAGGQITWEGLLYEMDLTVGGMTYRRTLDTMYNYVTTKYNDENDDSQTSDPASNDGAINRYGRREEILLLDNFPQASAEGQRDAYLKENAWPWARFVGLANQSSKEPTLVLRPCGYVFTANWRHTTITGGLDELSDVITLIGQADFELLNLGGIEENTFQVNKTLNIPQRCWDFILFLLELGDASQNIYRAYVDNDRRFYYRAIDPDLVQYFIRGGKVYHSAGGSQEVNYWQMKPGVTRIVDSPLSRREYNPWFKDGRDTFVDEVEFGDELDRPALKTAYFEESGILAAQASYQRQLEQERAAKRAARRRR